ncbi:DUF4365 domain-containing protein [Rathayibacter rathayi]|uniref:DUF4365 domain-containing protein n=1 Tax=Rathayibacter rathayi TaxID=33887 RepID=A0ABX5AEC7_RATRA|nr:DUF4365 domain-containing protein [Rathayibacter rathayi]PPF24240.1 hypothetical protein C5C34_05780 [Rathayibacter rathayi]PPF51561.1 hypothetical protein C5C08_01770 [Rathayibacter rathayi]PPF83152.1 hypothetical protein C5C14_01810 [Rathayibacter rathayi]PPG46982.1 hypothetical protein C5C20_01765 [Rathayibacter rathayi]PPG96556.1 hypothetical protein C5C22_02760 [Rathayibacter rathayi]
MTDTGADRATMTISHVLPAGSMPETAMKEELSKAYIHMLASATGLDIGGWNQDYDLRDITLKSRVEYPDLGDVGIDVQLKCTGQSSVVHPSWVSWELKPNEVERLRRTNRATPYMLCVLVTEHHVGHWLHHDVEGLLARSHMYYIWGRDLPVPIPAQVTRTVQLPIGNILTPARLLELMEEASAWRPIP